MKSKLDRDMDSWVSGGTKHILPRERQSASFDSAKMAEALYGGEDGVKSRNFILRPGLAMDYPDRFDAPKEVLMERSIRDFIDIHKKYTTKGFKPTRQQISFMGEMSVLQGPLMPHLGLFLPTIIGQGSQEQIMKWAPKALSFEIVGAYGQTELKQGSNIRGLQTTATFDPETDTFIINSNTLGGTKWWNSNVGVVATHVACYAQLIINGKEFGLHVFMVQLRDENHQVLPTIEVGTVGRTLSDSLIDSGYIRFNGTRIPRENMLAKRQHVERDGSYVKHVSIDDPEKVALAQRASYLTMMMARSGMISGAAGRLSIGLTIAIRYSCVREQGFKRNGGNSFKDEQNQVIDYQNQSYELFKWLAICYAMRASGNWISSAVKTLLDAANGDASDTDRLVSAMPEMHASVCGLKGMCCIIASDGLEILRRLCGGHGYLLSSGIAHLASSYVWQASAEGDATVLQLQTGRFLIKQRQNAITGKKELPGLVACLKPLGEPDFSIEKLKSRVPQPQSKDEVRSLEFLLQLFENRTVVAVHKVGIRLEQKLESGTPFDDAFNQCAVGIKAAVQGYVYFFMLKNFIEETRTLSTEYDENVSRALERLCSLFALQQIVEGSVLLWNGIVSEEIFDLAQLAVEDLLVEVRRDAIAYVDAFQIPDRLLGALGNYDGKVYEQLYSHARESAEKAENPFSGFENCLQPHLNQEFLKKGAAIQKGALSSVPSKL